MAKKIDYASLFTVRKDGRYQGSYRDENGKQRFVCDRNPEKLYFKLIECEKPKVKTFKEVAEEWEQEHVSTLADSTQATYKAPLQQVIDEHGEKPLNELTAQDVNRVMLKEKAKDYSYKHAACILSMYKQIYNYAIVQGYANNNPAQSVQVPRGLKRGTRQAPEDGLIRAIQNAVNKPFGLFAFFLLYTGFRVGEALGVKWEDIDTKDKVIHCRRTIENRFGKPYEKPPKTTAGERDVPLLPDLEKQLKKPKGSKSSDYIFGIDGRPMTTSEMRSRWTTWAKSIGYAELYETVIHDKSGKEVKKTYTRATIDRHTLRHGYATILYEAGVDELAAQELMGHADIATTHKIYTHLRQHHKADAADKIKAKFAEISSNGKANGKTDQRIDNA